MKKQTGSLGVNVSDVRFVTKAEAAAMLSVSTRTIDRMVDEGVLQKVAVRRRAVRFRIQDLLRLIGEGV